MPGESPSTFTVIHFSLEIGEDQRPVQRSATCGSFPEVAEALQRAREAALDVFNQLQSTDAFDAPSVVDTEWGYDVKLGPGTVHRFWVHENLSSPRLLQ